MEIRVEGIVQGVGFRPFVHSLAGRLGLSGWVGNDAHGVVIEAEGDGEALARLVDSLGAEAPPLAVVERVSVRELEPQGEGTFRITQSRAGGGRTALVSPDVATCADCLAEIADPAARRYRYPFTNCTNCGPRFTITTTVPYDRPNTTMAAFPMCPDCAAEYEDPADRRFHAQPICCPACGPQLALVGVDGTRRAAEDPLAEAAARVRAGDVVAIKGLGGYHLAVLAGDETAVAGLRRRKHRDDKPFAVMVADVAAAREWCDVGAEEAALLESPSRPVVLLERRDGSGVAPSVAPGNRRLGVMLPYTGLHHLLAAAVGAPFVLTSGNLSDEPIVHEDGEARRRLAEIADVFLVHDRPIHSRVDDSVTRVFRGREIVLRRSRGYAPRPVALPWDFPRPVLACGAELKHTFCLGKGHHAFVSHHIGDLENYETWQSFTVGVEHFGRLFDIRPEVVAHDLHPEYLSTKFALDLEEAAGHVALTGVQHHHAHVASCLADNGEAGPVIGVAFDGLGWGTDGTVWGGEILVADLAGFERVGHLETVPMPGGAAAIREPWRMAAAWLDVIYGPDVPDHLELRRRHADRWRDVCQVARSGTSSPATSSAGRLFDAVSALCGIRDVIRYEGQAAVELEQRADLGESGAYRLPVEGGSMLRLGAGELIQAVVDDLGLGAPVGVVAARFHRGLAAGVVSACRAVRAERGLTTVACSGGVFQNALLLGLVVDGLEAEGFRVLIHSRVPPNDGGISLGQAACAGARDR
ncbi:MAG TPA: carbamoyltransferase HypF [Acidimicrobiia bacterium]|nr:carbamoyltransferase HypF [Acidimicrobiia bacterium]